MRMGMLVVLMMLVTVMMVPLSGHFDHNSLMLRMFLLRGMMMMRFMIDMRRIMPVDVREVLFEHLKSPQVLVALSLAVLPLSAVFIQDEVQC